jgi:hypothetical protein
MAFKKQNIKSELMLTLPGGGEINTGLLDFKINESMKKVFTECTLLVLPRYISEVDGKVQQVDNIGSSNSSVSMDHIPEGGDTLRYLDLYEVTWDENGATAKPQHVATRTLIHPSSYYIGNESGSGEWEQAIFFDSDRSASTYGLELWSAMSSTEEVHVQEMFSHDFYQAVFSDVKSYLHQMAGTKYFNLDLSTLEQRNYMNAISQLKFKGNRRNVKGDLRVQNTNSFI